MPASHARDHQRAAKKRAGDIQYTRVRPKRVQLYCELIKITRGTLASLHHAALQLAGAAGLAVALWQAKVRHYRPLIEQIIAQTARRVLAGEPAPASDKLVSVFEPHADIIRKGSEVAYGHKLNLTTGRSALILDVVIETGNPADSERLLPMLERHVAFFGQPPRQAAADGSFASRDNLRRAKAQDVRDMAFHKRAGLRIEDMVKSRWVYRKLRNFRAGIEADISCLKRAYGLARCTWRGLGHFRATSGQRWSPTTSLSSPASSPPDATDRQHRAPPASLGHEPWSSLPPATSPSRFAPSASTMRRPNRPRCEYIASNAPDRALRASSTIARIGGSG
jgi:transposase, IS5 family